uniref:Uncharacterized protein n=1 Tax=Wuchereria bancrofti TaxID=6293 RepID=A0A1I8E8I6_WUCBA
MNTGNIAGSVHIISRLKDHYPLKTQRVLSDSRTHLRNTRILNLVVFVDSWSSCAQSTAARCKLTASYDNRRRFISKTILMCGHFSSNIFDEIFGLNVGAVRHLRY